ncbi:hypothetical protein [Luteipulveratus halotolerans]|uniref:Lipoprotein n=1 Tax=Luteipulveratus halotolerans TaxID=1631356 RepID=A0A0L6CER7_9MICO|nr:hypothetical protein [Luteipulveratus halotolerans]KNX36371.1 hypothetical protein VV01_03205 [Luteipulveratus halotolerans]
MRTHRRAIALPAIALAAALSMTACNEEMDAPPAADPTATSSATQAPSTEQPTSPETSSPAASPESTTDGGSATAAPRSSREDASDKSGLDAEASAIPAGPVTDITIKKLGGYSKAQGQYGTFYAVLDVNSSARGLVKLEYVLLDASGKELKTVKDNMAVGGTAHELKITRATGQLPPPSEGKVAKVRLRITENDANSYATVTSIDQITPGYDSTMKTATVSGRYKTDGKGSVTTLNAICSDGAGTVVAGNSAVDRINAPTWTPFKVTLFDAPPSFHATKCYVGS